MRLGESMDSLAGALPYLTLIHQSDLVTVIAKSLRAATLSFRALLTRCHYSQLEPLKGKLSNIYLAALKLWISIKTSDVFLIQNSLKISKMASVRDAK